MLTIDTYRNISQLIAGEDRERTRDLDLDVTSEKSA